MTQRRRPIVVAAISLALIWAVALTGFMLARHSEMTAEKVQAYLNSVDLSKLSPAERARAIQLLAEKMNALGPEERRKARMRGPWPAWFEKMTEPEKGTFIEATMPTGFKQMLTAFEELPPERRGKAIHDAVRRLREARDDLAAEGGPEKAPANSIVFSEELQQKVIATGLKSFYSQSSAKTKAEAAPLLEELQRSMENGRLFSRPGPPR